MAGRSDLEVEYESEAIRRYCESRTIAPLAIRAARLREVLTILLDGAGAPQEGKRLAWDVRRGKLLVLLADPRPPREVSLEEATRRKEEALATNLRNMLRSHTADVTFDGQTLEAALQAFAVRHGVNVIVEPDAEERCRAVTVRLARREETLSTILDELIRLDPELLWEVKGKVVVVRRK